MASRYPGWPREVPPDIRMTVDELADVIDYAVRLVGEDHVAIGADFDGGVPPPHGIEDISDYPKIREALVRKGYSEERIRKIMGVNLLRLIRTVTEKPSR
jgi:membrane dipeptidase